MKTECSVVRDLLPLYVEDMVNPETAQYVISHLAECPECKAELEILKGGEKLANTDNEADAANQGEHNEDKDKKEVKPFKKIMKRMNRRFGTLSYLLVVFFVFLGFSLTEGEGLMYNSLIMPIVGVFGYFAFDWKAIYKMPLLLLIVDIFMGLFKLVEFDLYSAVGWTFIYSIFVFAGIVIAFLLHYALRKENDK